MPLGHADRASYNRGRLTPRATRGRGEGALLPEGEGSVSPGRRLEGRRPGGRPTVAGRLRDSARGYTPDEIAERPGCPRRTSARRPGLIRETWLSSSPRRGHARRPMVMRPGAPAARRTGGPDCDPRETRRGPSPCLSIARSSPSRTRWRGPGASTRRASGTRPPGEPDDGRASRNPSEVALDPARRTSPPPAASDARACPGSAAPRRRRAPAAVVGPPGLRRRWSQGAARLPHPIAARGIPREPRIIRGASI